MSTWTVALWPTRKMMPLARSMFLPNFLGKLSMLTRQLSQVRISKEYLWHWRFEGQQRQHSLKLGWPLWRTLVRQRRTALSDFICEDSHWFNRVAAIDFHVLFSSLGYSNPNHLAPSRAELVPMKAFTKALLEQTPTLSECSTRRSPHLCPYCKCNSNG